MTTQDRNKAALQSAYDAWNALDREAFERHYGDALVVRNLHTGAEQTWTKDEHWAIIENTFAVFPDIRLTIEDMTAEGDKVVIRYWATATHGGTSKLLGEPTGKTARWASWGEYRFEDGRIVEVVQLADRLAMLTQFGAIEDPAST